MAALAPMAPTRVQPLQIRQTIVERRNYQQLKWNKIYGEYYQRDWKQETSKYLSNKLQLNENNKKSAINWRFYHYQNMEIDEIPSLRGHSLSDIGDSMITIGDRKKKEIIDVYKMNKSMNKMDKLQINGESPCCRFQHSAEYIPTINCILFFGGFDAQCNFNDARLLSLDHLIWFNLIYDANIDYRAYHSSASRLIKDKFECYIFGGQFCNGGPYEYHNDIFKFTFYNGSYDEDDEEDQDDDDNKDNKSEQFGYFECDELQINNNNIPRERSMSYSFIKDNTFYIFGGSYATSTLNDLWALDLNTNIWTEIQYKGILRAPMVESIRPKNFRVSAKIKPSYFDQKLNQLICIHYGKLTKIQKQYIKYDDTLSEFQQRLLMNDNDKDNKNNKKELKKGAVGLLHESLKCTIFVFDMREKTWFIAKNNNVGNESNMPSKLIGSTRVIRIGEFLIQMGGGYKSSNINYMKHIYLLKIPNYRLINTMSWSRERLLWIGYYKDNHNKGDNKDVSIFNKCATDLISLIISFLNPKPV